MAGGGSPPSADSGAGSVPAATPKEPGSAIAPFPPDRARVDGPAETAIFGEPSLLTPADGNGASGKPRRDGDVLSAVYTSKRDEGFDVTSSAADRVAAAVPQSPLGRWVLGFALLVLAIAALPRHLIPDGRLGYLLATRRIEVAALGGSLFLGVVVVLGLA
jgi:hypothetical protein